MNNTTPLQERVLKQITNNTVTMRPRTYFVVRASAFILLSLITLLASVAIINYILFSVRASHHNVLLSMGYSGVGMFLLFFPWFLVCIDIACIIGLQRLVQTFRIGYTTPRIYTIALALVCIALSAYVFDTLRASDRALERGHAYGIPLLMHAYEHAHESSNPERGVCPCVVKGISERYVIMTEPTPWGRVRDVLVVLPPDVATSSLRVGDSMFEIGTFDHGVLYAHTQKHWNPTVDGDVDDVVSARDK
jgi:hypothetical protein